MAIIMDGGDAQSQYDDMRLAKEALLQAAQDQHKDLINMLFENYLTPTQLVEYGEHGEYSVPDEIELNGLDFIIERELNKPTRWTIYFRQGNQKKGKITNAVPLALPYKKIEIYLVPEESALVIWKTPLDPVQTSDGGEFGSAFTDLC